MEKRGGSPAVRKKQFLHPVHQLSSSNQVGYVGNNDSGGGGKVAVAERANRERWGRTRKVSEEGK